MIESCLNGDSICTYESLNEAKNKILDQSNEIKAFKLIEKECARLRDALIKMRDTKFGWTAKVYQNMAKKALKGCELL